MSNTDPYIVLEGGLVQNEPGLPVLNLDAVDEGDSEGVTQLHQRVLEVIDTEYGADAPVEELPGSLQYILRRIDMFWTPPAHRE